MFPILRIGIMVAMFMAIGLAGSMLRQNVDEDETEMENIPEPENQDFRTVVHEFPIGEQITVSGLSYKVTNASVSDSLPSAGLEEERGGEYMLISMYVENMSEEPKSELKKSDFMIADSEDRKFVAAKSLALFFGESWSTLQPGLGGYRGLVFQIPFDDELEYRLLVGNNNIVELGLGKDLYIAE